MSEEIFDVVKKIAPKFLQLLAEQKPEEQELHKLRIQYALGPWPYDVRIYNAYLVLRAYITLVEGGRL